MTGQIGVDTVSGDDFGFFGTDPGTLENGFGKRFKSVGWNGRHGFLSLLNGATGGFEVLLGRRKPV
ncbi:MAG: hypothetical protein VW709_04525, partial [Rickettsiales bacterium]